VLLTRLRLFPLPALVIAVCLGLTGCSSEEVDPPAPDPKPAPVTKPPPQASDIIRPEEPVPGQYLFSFNEELVAPIHVQEAAEKLTAEQGGTLQQVFDSSILGFVASGLDDEKALAIAADYRVKAIAQDGYVKLESTFQTNPIWNLDRIDERAKALNKGYEQQATGLGVNAYVIDTGILATHSEFTGRLKPGFTAIADGKGTTDCQGHGTHVAGTVGGTTWGVAKAASLYPVRVLDCAGRGTNSGVIAGVDWVTKNHKKPAVANMSLGGGANSMLDEAVRKSILAGVTYVVAAGNSNLDACTFSPARTAEALTVGASDINDRRAAFSNWGACVDIFAPGVDIKSAWHTGNDVTNSIQGTSMASPHVAGVAALYLEKNPTATPAQVTKAILDGSTPNLVADPKGSPNRLLYSSIIPPAPPPELKTGVNYAIISKGSAKLLGVSGGSTADGALIVQGPKAGVDFQQWMLQDGGGGHYFIVVKHTGKVLTVQGGGTADYTPIVQATKTGAAHQLWRLDPIEPGFFNLTSKPTGKALVVEYASTDTGARMILHTNLGGGGGTHRWRFEEYAPPIQDGILYGIVSRHSAKVLEVSGGSTAESAQIVQRGDEVAPHQRWQLQSAGGGYYFISAQHSGKVLTVQGGGTADYTPIVQATKAGGDHQLWRLEPAGDGYYFIFSKQSGKALVIEFASTSDGARMILHINGAGGNNHRWKFEPQVVTPGKQYYIASKASPRVLEVTGGSAADNAAIVQGDKVGYDYQQWQFQPAGGGYYFINVLHTGKVITAQGGGTADYTPIVQAPNVGGDHQRWRLDPTGDGSYYIHSKHSGKALVVEFASTASGARMILHDNSLGGGGTHRWRFDEYVPPIQEGRAYGIFSNFSGKVLDVTGGSTADGTQIVQFDDGGLAHQRWFFQPAGDGHYFIAAQHSGKVITVQGGGTADYTPIVQETKTGGDHQRWKLQPTGNGNYFLLSKPTGKALVIEFASTSSGARVILHINGASGAACANHCWIFR
jgi:subtilisin family serine protease